jgi:hypothetical protein
VPGYAYFALTEKQIATLEQMGDGASNNTGRMLPQGNTENSAMKKPPIYKSRGFKAQFGNRHFRRILEISLVTTWELVKKHYAGSLTTYSK